MIHRDFVLIETPPTVTNAVRVITMMSTKERIDSIRERPDLMFKVIGQEEKDKLMAKEQVMVTQNVETVELKDKGISIRRLSLPVDLEKMLEEL